MGKRFQAALIEPVPVDDTFATELAAIENVGPCLRLTLCVEDSLHEAGGEAVRRIRCKLVIPRASMLDLLLAAMAFLDAEEARQLIERSRAMVN